MLIPGMESHGQLSEAIFHKTEPIGSNRVRYRLIAMVGTVTQAQYLIIQGYTTAMFHTMEMTRIKAVKVSTIV